jgi:hypothetical protein
MTSTPYYNPTDLVLEVLNRLQRRLRFSVVEGLYFLKIGIILAASREFVDDLGMVIDPRLRSYEPFSILSFSSSPVWNRCNHLLRSSVMWFSWQSCLQIWGIGALCSSRPMDINKRGGDESIAYWRLSRSCTVLHQSNNRISPESNVLATSA